MNIDTFNELKADRTLLFKGLRGSVKSGVNAMDKFATKWISYSDELNTVSIDMEDINGMVVWFKESTDTTNKKDIAQAKIELEAFIDEFHRNFPSVSDMKTLINEAPIVEETIEAPTIENEIKEQETMLKKDIPNGFTFYRGPSMLNGEPIRAVATSIKNNSQNEKTGPMIQIFIMPDDIKPSEALKTGQDEAGCGDCVHRPSLAIKNGASPCYVQVWQSVNQVWKTSYEDITNAEHIGRIIGASGKSVRFGAWGDPAMVPVDVMGALLRGASHHTGYTHQWRLFPKFRHILMASVDTIEEREEAKKAGWRTFRVAEKYTGEDVVLSGEILCPASVEAGKRTTCDQCGLCAGLTRKAKDIMIPVHGSKSIKANKTSDITDFTGAEMAGIA